MRKLATPFPSPILHLPAGSAWSVLLLGAAMLVGFPLGARAERAYVSNEDGESVTVLDATKGEVINTVYVGKRPRGLKLNHDGSRLYVAVSGLPKCPPSVPDEECAKLKRDLTADGVAVIDTSSLKLLNLLKAGSDPEQFDLSPDGKRLFISNEDAGALTVLNVASGAVEGSVQVGREPEGVRLTPNGRLVVVTSESGNSISLIDARSLQLKKTIAVGKRPRDVAFSIDGKNAYISGEFDASVYTASIPDGTTATRFLQLRSEDRPMGILLDGPRNRLYVSTGRGGTVAVIALAGPSLIGEVAAGARPWGIAMSKDARRLFTANGSSNDVTIIDLQSLQVIKKIAVGKSPWGIVLGP